MKLVRIEQLREQINILTEHNKVDDAWRMLLTWIYDRIYTHITIAQCISIGNTFRTGVSHFGRARKM